MEKFDIQHECPNCGAEFDAVQPVGGDSEPKVGDITLCPECGSTLVFGESNALHVITEEERAALPEKVQSFLELLRGLVSVVRASKKNLPQALTEKVQQTVASFKEKLFSGEGASPGLCLMSISDGEISDPKEFDINAIMSRDSGPDIISMMVNIAKKTVENVAFIFIAEAYASSVKRHDGESDKAFRERAESLLPDSPDAERFHAVVVRYGYGLMDDESLVYRVDSEKKELIEID